MVTGCAPFFLLGLLGVSLGSWFFGSHLMARITGLAILTAFLAYFALLNWTAQTNMQNPRASKGESPPQAQEAGGAHAETGEEIPFTAEDRKEWVHYLRTEGRLLWFGVMLSALTIVYLVYRG